MAEPLVSRRELLAGAAATGAVTIIGSSIIWGHFTAQAAEEDGATPDVEHTQYGFMMNLENCVGCEHCVEACRYYNKLSDDTPDRRHVIHADQNYVMTRHLSYACMHCADPGCMAVCPAQAITKGAAGIVNFDPDRCIGCKYCYQGCPFDIPRYNNISMDKCNVCLRADPPVAPGDPPYCVRACMFNALHWGPLDELKKLADGHVLEGPTTPSCVLVEPAGAKEPAVPLDADEKKW